MASTSHINKPESGAWWSTLSSAAARDDPDADSELDTEDLEWEERERELMRKEFEESMQQSVPEFLEPIPGPHRWRHAWTAVHARVFWINRLKVLLELIILPYAGKYFGRKLAFWGTFPKVAGQLKQWLSSSTASRTSTAWAKYVDFGIWGLARSLVPWRSTPIRT